MPLTRASRISETEASGVLEGLIPESPLLCVNAVANHLWLRFIIAFFRRAFCCFRLVLHHILPARALTHSRNLYTMSTYLWYRA
jgi:hypothetical protein